jgi:segregation and condensation protein A
MYEVRLDQFSGPMEKLLELIESQKLEITQVSLAAVTGDFIKHVESLGERAEPTILADFVVVASRLLLIKSKTLLPNLELTEEEQGDIVDLELRLKLYQEFKVASGHIRAMWDQNAIAYSRPRLPIKDNSSAFKDMAWDSVCFRIGSSIAIHQPQRSDSRLSHGVPCVVITGTLAIKDSATTTPKFSL